MSNQLRLLFFIVVISGALCTVEDYVIMSQCAHNKAIHVAAEGTVSVTDISQTQNITIVGLPDYVNNDFKIALYAKETQRYLCFNENWRLVGMKELQDTCYFNETIVHGYFVFRSVVDLQRRVGFTHRGKAIGPKKNVNDACYLFTKIQADQFFHQHTDYFAPKSKTTSPTSTATSLSTRTTTMTTTTLTMAANGGRSKTSRNKNNRLYNNRMRNNSNTNQNQQHANGHSNNISSYSNNNNNKTINLVSNRQDLNLSQQHSNHNRNNNTREHVQQLHLQHQVRHHHNDPNAIARRQQHEQKQKRRQRNRTRTTTASLVAAKQQANATTTATSPLTSVAMTTSRHKQHEAVPTVTNTRLTTTATGITTTIAATKRKGRRRKGDRKHKKHVQGHQKQQHQKQESVLVTEKNQQQEQQKQPSPNSKDPQHKRKYIATTTDVLLESESEPTATTYSDIVASSMSSTSDYASASTGNEWISLETAAMSEMSPTVTATATSTFETDDIFSTLTSSTTDFDAADMISNNLLESTDITYTSPADEMMSTTNVVATSTVGGNMLLSTHVSNSIINTKKYAIETSDDSESPSPSPSQPTTYYDKLDTETTIDSDITTLLAPTPILIVNNVTNAKWQATTRTDDTKVELEYNNMAGDEYATTTSYYENETDSSTSSNTGSTSSDTSSDPTNISAEATETFNDTDATADAYTYSDELAAEIEQQLNASNSNFSENIIDDYDNAFKNVSNMLQQQYYTSTHATHSAAPTLATFLYNKLTASTAKQQQPPAEEASTEPKSTATTAAASASTTLAALAPWSHHGNISNSRSNSNILNNGMTEFIYSTRSSNHNHNNSKHRNVGNKEYQHQLRGEHPLLANNFSNTSNISNHSNLFSINKNINNNNMNNTLNEGNILATPTTAVIATTASAAASASATLTTTRKSIRKSTQKLLATPFHQLTYVRNNAGDIDIDNIDNISIYPDLMEAVTGGGEDTDFDGNSGNSRLTIVSGYLPTSATATLPESLRLAKMKFNERKRLLLRQRHIGSYA